MVGELGEHVRFVWTNDITDERPPRCERITGLAGRTDRGAGRTDRGGGLGSHYWAKVSRLFAGAAGRALFDVGVLMPEPSVPQPFPAQEPTSLPESPHGGYPPAAQPTGYTTPSSSVPVYPSSSDVPPVRRTRTGLTVLIVVCAVVVLLGVGVVVAVLLGVSDESIGSRTTLVAPETLGGRARYHEPQMQAVLDRQVAELKADLPRATSVIAAAYGDPARRDLVVVSGAATRVSDPGRALEQYLAGVNAGGLNLTAVMPIEPGPLGGVARCADAQEAGVDLGVCAWADRGSIGMVIMYFTTVQRAQAEFVAIRAAIERRS